MQVPKDSKDRKAGKEAIAAIREIIGDEETFKKLFWFSGAYSVALSGGYEDDIDEGEALYVPTFLRACLDSSLLYSTFTGSGMLLCVVFKVTLLNQIE